MAEGDVTSDGTGAAAFRVARVSTAHQDFETGWERDIGEGEEWQRGGGGEEFTAMEKRHD